MRRTHEHTHPRDSTFVMPKGVRGLNGWCGWEMGLECGLDREYRCRWWWGGIGAWVWVWLWNGYWEPELELRMGTGELIKFSHVALSNCTSDNAICSCCSRCNSFEKFHQLQWHWGKRLPRKRRLPPKEISNYSGTKFPKVLKTS